MLYKLRGECGDDFIDFETMIRKYDPTYIRVDSKQLPPFPDFEASFASVLSLKEIRNLLRLVLDGHVMLQTVARAEDYTGERNYDLM